MLNLLYIHLFLAHKLSPYLKTVDISNITENICGETPDLPTVSIIYLYLYLSYIAMATLRK